MKFGNEYTFENINARAESPEDIERDLSRLHIILFCDKTGRTVNPRHAAKKSCMMLPMVRTQIVPPVVHQSVVRITIDCERNAPILVKFVCEMQDNLSLKPFSHECYMNVKD